MLSRRFICATKKYSMGERGAEHIVGAPMFRRAFCYTAGQTAELTICGLGFYELYINGVNITKGKMAPYISNPDVCCYYDLYDIKEYLVPGMNVVGVILGNGFLNPQVACWEFDKAPYRCAPKFALAMMLNDKLAFEADEEFRWMQSPVIYNDLRYGEYYDARLEIKSWCSPDFSASDWNLPIMAETPKGEPRLCEAEPVCCTKDIAAVCHWKIEQGYLYDFGINLSGVCRLKINGRPGQTIRFQHGEALLEGRSLYIKNTTTPEIHNKGDWQTDVYICKGGEAVYEPRFTYHGFRYVFVEGISDEQATDDLLTMLVWHSDISDRSSWKTDNPIINKLQSMTVNSDLSNLLYVITDCPHREKNGWTGDVALSCEQMLYNFDCAATMREWLRNLSHSQRNDGAIPAICPTSGWGYEWGNGPAWDLALIEVPYQVYRFTGNETIIYESLPAIEKYLHYFISRRNEDGLVAFGLPDWCETLSVSENLSSTPLEVTDSLTAIEIFQKAAFLASCVKQTELQNKYREYAEEFVYRFRKKYLGEEMCISCRTQTAQAKALSVGVFTKEEESAAFQKLLELIEQCGHFKTGVLGARVLFRVLCDHGMPDLAYRLITQEELPSFKWWINQGLTSLGESINETFPNSILRKDGSRMLSLNHHFWGDISACFFRYILGMNINPDFTDPNHIELRPVAFQNINYAAGTYKRNGCTLTVEVYKTGEKDVKVRIIENTGFRLS